MSGLVRKLLLPLSTAALFFLPKDSFAQDTTKVVKNFIPQTYMSAAVNYYADKDPLVNEVYGGIVGFRASILRDINENFRLELGVNSAKDKGKLTRDGVTVNSNLSLFAFEGTAQYVDPWQNRDGATYFRAGFTTMQVKSNAWAQGQSGSASNQGTGFIYGVGFDLNVNSESKIFLETTYRSLTGNVEMNGSEILLGYKRTLGKK